MESSEPEFLKNVRPPEWVNPSPRARYHLVVIGGGTAGLVSAAGAAGLGASVALIEKARLGGDCLNFGCVPSKALLRCARAAADVRASQQFGIPGLISGNIRFTEIMERLRKLQTKLSPNDSAERFRSLGVDVFFGTGRFLSPDQIQVGDAKLRFGKAIVATGTRPKVPKVSGLSEVGFLTNETIFSIRDLPRRLLVLGGGPIGCELAQAFARLGAEVTLVCRTPEILPRDDPHAARFVRERLSAEGVRVLLSAEVSHVERGSTAKVCRLRDSSVEVDEILLAVGRTPNVEDLSLDLAGIRLEGNGGVEVDDRLRTSHPRVFAVGDVASKFKFTHAADALARLAIRNALFMGRSRASDLILPWCTYTEPELAHVGLTPALAADQKVSIQTFDVPFSHLDRAVLDGQEGLLRVHVKAGSDRIVGATMVGPHAGEILGNVVVAMKAKKGLRDLSTVVQPYPTLAEAIKKAGDAFQRTRLTPWTRWLLGQWLRWQ